MSSSRTFSFGVIFAFFAILGTGCLGPRAKGDRAGQSGSAGALAPTLGIEDASFIKLTREHSIDEFLDLVFHQHYRFQFRPVIQRPQSGISDLVREPVVHGKFRIRGVLLANESDTRQVFVSSFDVSTESQFGRISADIDFSYTFRELPLVASRNRLVLELEETSTVGEPVKTVIEAPILTGIETGQLFFTYRRESLASIVREALRLDQDSQQTWTDSEIDAMIGKSKVAPKVSELSPVEYFRQTYGLQYIPDESLQALQLRARDLDALLEPPGGRPDPVLLKRLCELFYPKPEAEMARNFTNNPDATQIGRCRKSPLDYLHYTPTKHIQEITSKPAVTWSDGPNLRVSASYAREAVHAKHDIRDGVKDFDRVQHGVDAIVKRSFDMRRFAEKVPFISWILPEVGVQYQAGWQRGRESYSAVQTDDVFVEANQFQIIEFHNLTISDLAVAFRARTQRCFVVGKKDWSTAGFLYCDQATPEELLEEHWYYVFEWFQDQSNPLRDTRVLRERPWTKLIRGKTRYDAFRESVIKKENRFVFVQDEPVAETSNYLRNTFFPQRSVKNGHIFDDNFPGRFY
jgi:hypothetical protein